MSLHNQSCAAYMSSVEKSEGLEFIFPLAEHHWESFYFLFRIKVHNPESTYTTTVL